MYTAHFLNIFVKIFFIALLLTFVHYCYTNRIRPDKLTKEDLADILLSSWLASKIVFLIFLFIFICCTDIVATICRLFMYALSPVLFILSTFISDELERVRNLRKDIRNPTTEELEREYPLLKFFLIVVALAYFLLIFSFCYHIFIYGPACIEKLYLPIESKQSTFIKIFNKIFRPF